MPKKIPKLKKTTPVINIARKGIGKALRPKGDLYTTPREITKLLLQHKKLKGTILEPACGKGDISEVILQHGYKKLTSSDMYDWEYGKTGIDFTTNYNNETFDTVITNPPYGKDVFINFMKKAKSVAKHEIIVLVPLHYILGITRYKTIWKDKEFPIKHVYYFPKRFSCHKMGIEHKRGNGKLPGYVDYCWVVLRRGYKGKTTQSYIEN